MIDVSDYTMEKIRRYGVKVNREPIRGANFYKYGGRFSPLCQPLNLSMPALGKKYRS